MSVHTFPDSLETGLRMLAAGQWTAEELTNHCLERIHSQNPELNAFLTVSDAYARQRAHAVDTLATSFPEGLGPLAGAPISIKDLIHTSFAPTTYGSQIYRDYRPTANASVVQRLERAHAIIVGKTHLHEFAYGITNENAHYGPARNPVDTKRMTGGSSGGSAASVRASLALASIGTDTGGSIRIPASLTGIVGYKPTHGLVPVDGVLPLASTLDHVGPLTRTVRDAALLTDVLALTHGTGSSLLGALDEIAEGPLRIGIPSRLVERFATDPVANHFAQLVSFLEESHLVNWKSELRFDEDEIALHQGNIQGAEAFSVHRTWLQEHGHLYGEDVFERLQTSSKISAQDYIYSLAFRQAFQREIDGWFDEIDVILLPTTPVFAPILGTESVVVRGEASHIRPLMTRFTNPWNLSGMPAISIPGGIVDGLPFGLQLVGRFGKDARLLQIAARVEQALTDWNETTGGRR
ncbi:amidase [Alicyclobacillus fastidiosus]|uniref:Amidase n=1 Tax=Alicyclobacillus fastidiosus TaxID=392011 RepID=A0ABY6ZCZ0_9BACL|nr:amidase [Alicyclobacillus fastidiosus]WAH40387.1 amidase [Alicyclobacillus fastidiosus]GMA61777.1 amidase [Alicyclobacillus fastidiosus]